MIGGLERTNMRANKEQQGDVHVHGHVPRKFFVDIKVENCGTNISVGHEIWNTWMLQREKQLMSEWHDERMGGSG